MSRATPDDQLKFLLSCVRHSNNGKIDFVEVARECGVVSKGAAAKRYERLLKANGIHPSGGSAEKPSVPAPKQRSKADIARAADAKRRKLEMDTYNLKVDDEDDYRPYLKSEPLESARIKPEPGVGFAAFQYQQAPISPQPSYFQRQYMPHNAVPYAQAQHFLQFRPSMQYHRTNGTPPQVTETPPASRHENPLQDPVDDPMMPYPLSATSIPDEPITSTFDDFRSQDLFEPVDLDQTFLPKGSVSMSEPNVDVVSNELQTSSIAATPFLPEKETQVTRVKEESLTTAMSNLSGYKPSGSGVEDSILITD